jgi:hypothetical protein
VKEASTVSRRVRRAAIVLAQLALTGGVTWFILRAVGLSLEELRALDLSRWRLRWELLLLSSILLLGAYLFAAGLWGLMVRELGGPEVGMLASLRIFFTANLGRYLPGKVWQIAGVAVLAQRGGVRASTATAAALLGQAFSLAGATLVGLGVVLEGGGREVPGGGVTAVALACLLLLLTFPRVLWALVGAWFRVARETPPAGFRPDQAFGVRWMGLYAAGWILQGVAFWVLALAMGLPLTALAGVPAYAAAYLLGYLAIFAPAGLGVREGVLVVFLGPTLGAGGAALAVVARLWATVLELLPALVLAGGYLASRRKGAPGGG